MKSVVVPAQVTTLEDKIAGSLSLTQLLLLICPVLVGGFIYLFLPPFMGFAWYKLVLFLLGLVVFVSLSIRFRGELLLNRLILLFRFNLRSRYYVYNKNDNYLREDAVLEEEAFENVAKESSSNSKRLGVSDLARLEKLSLTNVQINFVKGGVNVCLNQDEGQN